MIQPATPAAYPRKSVDLSATLAVDPAHPVAPLVHIPGKHASGSGTVYFVDVRERQARLVKASQPTRSMRPTMVRAVYSLHHKDGHSEQKLALRDQNG